ncbi:hypothetical protein BA065_00960 [Nanoarchaeota archaeon NZ13-N]|nr:MAG: hypothetical protein BA065_00960 [Nanoarchaeota archaeon NZ13-N]
MALIGRRIIKNRRNMEMISCPLCGHVFYSTKQYTKHLNKSHLRKVPKDKRRRKKMLKGLLILKIKKENNIELEKYEKIFELKSKLNNIKL